jgi:hypothetical protein
MSYPRVRVPIEHFNVQKWIRKSSVRLTLPDDLSWEHLFFKFIYSTRNVHESSLVEGSEVDSNRSMFYIKGVVETHVSKGKRIMAKLCMRKKAMDVYFNIPNHARPYFTS